MPNGIPLTAQEKQAESEVYLHGWYSMLEFQNVQTSKRST
jgi:hypothetical protein